MRRPVSSFLILVLVSLLWGCSGSDRSDTVFLNNGGGQPTGGPSSTDTQGNLILRHTLEPARQVQSRVAASVTDFRITGLDLAGNVVFPTSTFPKSEELALSLPLETHTLRIEYLAGQDVTGLALVLLSLAPGQSVTISDPEILELTAVLATIQVSPATATLAAGFSQGFSATGIFQDGTTQDLTGSVTWSTSDESVATISQSSGQRGLTTGVAPGSVQVRAALGSLSGQADLTVTSATLASLTVTPVSPSVALGTTLRLTATGVFTDGTSQDLTTQVSWTSSAGAVGGVNSGGLFSANGVGTTRVSASRDGLSGSTEVVVSDAVLTSLVLTPANPGLALGTNQALVATGTFSDGTTQDLTSSVTWSSDSGSAAVSNATGLQGLVSALGVGTSTISATRGGVTGQTVVTVNSATVSSITVTPVNPALPLGTGQAFVATATFSDGTVQDFTEQVTWSSSSAGLTVSNATGIRGQATGIAVGSATVSATHAASGLSGSTVAQVTPAVLESIQVTPSGPSLALQTSLQMIATGVYSDASTRDLTSQVTWSSTGGVVVSNAAGSRGLLTATVVGPGTVQASFGSVTSPAQTVTVTAASLVSLEIAPVAPALALGQSLTFTATGNFSDGTSQDLTGMVSWISSQPAVGTVTGPAFDTVAAGQTVVSATQGAISTQTTVTVTAPTLSSLAVTPVNPGLANGTTQSFSALGTFSDGSTRDLTTEVTWTSSSPAIAAISNAAGTRGLATALSAGPTTISAQLGSITGSTTLTVSGANLVSVVITPQNPNLPRGTTFNLAATANFTAGPAQDVTGDPGTGWSSLDTNVVTVSSTGVLTAVNPGQTTVRASFGGNTASTLVTVTEARLTTLTLSPANPTLAQGTSSALTAVGTFTDGTMVDLTSQVSWSSSTPATAQVSNAAGSRGLVTGLVASGSPVTLSALLDGVTGTTQVTVTAASLVGIIVLPAEPTVPRGSIVNFSATGVFSDGTTQVIAPSWSSSAPGVATINSAGLLTASTTNSGSTTITATGGVVSGSTIANVTDAALTSITVTPANPSAPVGVQVQFTATGAFTDGVSRDVTSLVTWSSTNAAQASISNSSGTRGLATANGVGAPTIQAQLNGMTGSTTMTVNTAALVSIALTPFQPSLPKGITQQMTATGTFSDGTTANITGTATWSSNNGNATVSNSAPSKGLATAVNLGNSTITATQSSINGTMIVTVTDAALTSIAITSGSGGAAAVPKNSTRQLVATGNYSDGSSLNLTSLVTWSVAPQIPPVLSVSDAAATKGLATALGVGSATVQASFQGFTDSVVASVVENTDLIDIDFTSPNTACGNNSSSNPTITADGTKITYISSSTNLIASDANGTGQDVYLRSGVGTVGALTTKVSLIDGGTTQTTDTSSILDAQISRDGNFVVYSSFSTVFGPVVPAWGSSFVYRRNLATNQTQLVSDISGSSSGSDNSDAASVSSDGRFIAYRSAHEHNGVPSNTVHIYRRDMNSSSDVNVSAGDQGLNNFPSISGDGNLVAFTVTGNINVPIPGVTDANNSTALTSDVLLRDISNSSFTLVSHNSSSLTTTGNTGVTGSVSIAADGSCVYFASNATDHVSGDTNGRIDIFKWTRSTGAITRVNLSNGGAQAVGGDSLNPRCSADGRFVIFESEATNLVTGDTNGAQDIFVRDTVANTTHRVSVDPVGREANGRSFSADINANCTAASGIVTFVTRAPNLDARITNSFDHIVKAVYPPPTP